MSGANSRMLMLALRAWLDEDERNPRRIAEHIVNRATAGHFAYFRLLLDMVDGPIRPTAEEEMTGEAEWVSVVADDGWDAATVQAA